MAHSETKGTVAIKFFSLSNIAMSPEHRVLQGKFADGAAIFELYDPSPVYYYPTEGAASSGHSAAVVLRFPSSWPLMTYPNGHSRS
jgi:hypothetical protein